MESITRNSRIALNIKESSVMRAASIGINLLLVPLMLDFLGTHDYGIWLTISSFLGWSSLLDLGIGNGLKNRLSEARANGHLDQAKAYTSSAYAILGMVAVGALLIFGVCAWMLDWADILNAAQIGTDKLRWMLLIFALFFVIKLVLNQVVNIASAAQRTSVADLVNLVVNGSLLFLVMLMSTYAGDKLMLTVILFSAVPVLVLLAVSIWAFKGPYADYRPSLKSIDWTVGKDVMGLGFSFLLIQLAGIVLFSTDNLIISHYIDPSAVTSYHISYRYFGIVITFFSILCTPIWPAYSEAYQKGDIAWIKSITKRLIRVWKYIAVILVGMLIAAPLVYRLWVGEEIVIAWELNIIMALYVMTVTWGTIFVTFVNSTGMLRVQLIFSVIVGVLNIPLSVFIIKYTDLGAAGVMLATLACLSYGPIVSVIQYKKIINGEAKGIWAK